MAFPVFMFTVFQINLVAAQCSKPPVIFNFGDSNSDTGGGAALLGGPFVYPNGRTFFQEPTGRFCDGHLIIDFLCESLDSKYLMPFTEAVDRNFSNDVNFALSGSGIASATVYPFPLNVQILEFIRFRNRSIQLCSRDAWKGVSGDDGCNIIPPPLEDLPGYQISPPGCNIPDPPFIDIPGYRFPPPSAL